MNISINNGRLNMTDATKEELKALAEFMFADIPYNTVNEPENIEVEVVRVEEPKIVEEPKAEVDDRKTVTMNDICDIYKRKRQTIEWHVKHGMKPIEGKYPRIWYLDEVDKYLKKHMGDIREYKEVAPIENSGKLIVGMKRLTELTGKSASTLKWHIKHGMPYIDSTPMMFDYNECMNYLKDHIRTKEKKETTENVEVDRYYGKKLYTIQEIADMNNTSHQLLRNRVKIHNIPSKKEKNVSYYLLSDWEKEFNVYPLPIKKQVTSYSLWSEDQRKKCRDKGKDVGKCFSLAFSRMHKDYGISWEQVRKDFYYANQYSAKSTIQLAYFLQYEQKHNDGEHYENLFENMLHDVLETA